MDCPFCIYMSRHCEELHAIPWQSTIVSKSVLINLHRLRINV